MNNILFVNPTSGSFDELSLNRVVDRIKEKFNQQVVHHDNAQLINNQKNKLIIVRTQYADHAKELSSVIDLNNIHIIFIMGGDGIVHEVVNGLYQNRKLKFHINHNKLILSVIPSGSGNHLSKVLNIKSFEDWIESLYRSAADPIKLTKVFPTVVQTAVQTIVQTTVQTAVQTANREILSINTIVGGLPKGINDTASFISKYIPKFIGWIKYDISTFVNLFFKKSFRGREAINLICDNDHHINNVIAIFIQTTESCGADLIISRKIKLDQKNISMSYFTDHNVIRILYEFIKEKLGYQSNYLIRSIDNYQTVCLKGVGNITIDGQNEQIPLDCTIKRSTEYINFLSN